MMSARDVALDLAANHGIPVFPCLPNKEPATKNGFKDATTDLDQIERWFKDDTLIGIPTGEASGLAVVDVDPDGIEWYRNNVERLGCGYIARTRREGYHLYFKHPRGLRNSASKLTRGVDIRGDGGYAVYWPGAGLQSVGGLDEVTPFPQWILDSLAPKPAPAMLPDNAPLPGMAGEGGRNDFLSRHAFKLRKTGLNLQEILAAVRVTNQQRCIPPLPDEEVVKIVQGKVGVEPEPSSVSEPVEPKKITFRPLHEIVSEQREPDWLLHKVLEANVLAVLAGQRGTFKSFIALDWAMRCACAGMGVVMLSGEGAGLDRRAEAWRRIHKPDLDFASIPFVALERPVNLRMVGELAMLSDALGELPWPARLVITDTFSKFSAGIDENDNGEVSSYLAGLNDLIRERYKATVLLVAHAGHGDAKRPRGASALMANPDAEYIVERPPGMLVTVTRERFKDSPALDPLSYEGRSVDLGRYDAYGEPVTSLALVSSAPPPRILKQPNGKVQRQLLSGLRNLQKDAKDTLVWTLADLRQVARSSGASKQAAFTAAEALTLTGFLTPSVGGYIIAKDSQIDG